MDYALAIDIGATKLAVGVVDSDGLLHERASSPTQSSPDGAHGSSRTRQTGDEVFDRLAQLLGGFAPFDRFACCGVGCSGPMSADGELVSPLNIEAFRSFPLAAKLRELTGLNCKVENDAQALALAEGWVGGAVGVENYMAIVVSTGIGGGIVLNRRLLQGGTGNAGHIGQLVVATPGRSIPGHVAGTLEAEASGAAIAIHSGHVANEAPTAVVAEAGTLVGRAAGSVANLLDLQLVLVAGSVAMGFGEPFFAAAQAEMHRICRLEFAKGARIEPAGCGDEGPLIGAGAVGLRDNGNSIGIS
ncbi:MAG: ROK family protein [Acidimicrobiales bacterium]